MSKFTLLLIFLGAATVHAESFSQVAVRQQVTLQLRDTYLKDVLWAIEQQTSFTFLYNQEDLDRAGRVNVAVDGASVEEAIVASLRGTGLTYTVRDGVIVIAATTPSRAQQQPQQPQAQTVQITGKVTDRSGNPLPGATISVKGRPIGTVTDAAGNYRLILTAPEGAVLIFSYLGMEAQEVTFTGQTQIDVAMRQSATQVEEVIVRTGYQNLDLRETASAVQVLQGEDINISGLQTIDVMLEGHVPGMIFMQNSGQAGAAPRLRIRGTSTVLGSQEPVWVIDGIVQESPVNISPEQINDLDFVNLVGNAISGINPDDIESVAILKDASATALYGARAANGVIVITTKQGRQGPPQVSYSFSGTFTSRPHYSDASVNMMNSRERVDFSRELLEKRVQYPRVEHWLGYEGAMMDYWTGRISFDEMQRRAGYYESINTDWFGLLTQNTLSTKHTVSLSGGTNNLRYYTSAGMDDTKGVIRGEVNKLYTATLNLVANYNRWSLRFNMNANAGDRRYTPTDVDVVRYAYETTRALPAYNEDGSLWFYPRQVHNNVFHDFSIINEMNNSSFNVRSAGAKATAVLDYRISSSLRASVTGSYSTANTTQENWHGEQSFYAARLRLPAANRGMDYSLMPFGGEMIYQNTELKAYTARAQIDFNKFLDEGRDHFFTAAAGSEITSAQYFGVNRTFRGYLKERGRKMAAVNAEDYPVFAQWQLTDSNALGVWQDQLTNRVSGYATASYTYRGVYTLNANARFDQSNRFGARANDRLSPVWSIAGRWHIKEDILRGVQWIDELSLRGSFGYQGNMLENISSQLILQREGINNDFGEYVSTIYAFANPNLRWEKTQSYNTTLDFSLFRNRLAGTVSYFYKKTNDAFLTTSISSINGKSNWVVNAGRLENQGVEIGLRITLIDNRWHNPNGVRWSMNTNFGRVTNNVAGARQDRTLTNIVTYQNYLNGTIEIQGRPMNSFYSYQYQNLSPLNGAPVFYGSDRYVWVNNQRIDLWDRYQNMEATDVFADVMVYSGTRVPTLQGGIQHSVAFNRFSVAINTSYSIGSKIRLLRLYSTANPANNTLAPLPSANVRREFLDRWRQPGDERHTNIPGVISGADFQDVSSYAWWRNMTNANGEPIAFANTLWDMYDNSDLRVVSGNFLKIQAMTVRYNVPDKFAQRLGLRSIYVGLSGTNLLTVADRSLRGQDPATQSGSAPTINLSLRPTYSFNLNISF